ncbi:MAG: hypothetical protein KAI39_08575 [Desulfobulbaceae bacterium]|nr:hypothetical protein [Desulfobulbaceae bacterium]
MEYKMVVRKTMFNFDLTGKGNVKLRSVRFLGNAIMKKKNDLLLVTENNSVQFFLDQATPISRLSSQQFKFITAASKYFGYMPDHEQMPVWLWAGSLNLPEDCEQVSNSRPAGQVSPACC